jgi:hypothetical protein
MISSPVPILPMIVLQMASEGRKSISIGPQFRLNG